MVWQDYLLPTSVEEALEILKAHKGRARVIAGGTDLLLQLREGALAVECLVDITRIEDLHQIRLEGNTIEIGAAVTHAQVAASPLIQGKARVLADAAREVGSVQTRNQGTVVGNVVNAQSAADAAIALLALEAEARVVGHAGEQWVPIEQLYEGTGLSKVNSTAEIVTAVRFQALGEHQGSGFARLARRRALALPVVNAAAVVALQDDCFSWGRIAAGPVAPTPYRARTAEEQLRGARVEQAVIWRVAEMAAQEAQPRSSPLRGSREYRREMVGVLVRRALEGAVRDAGRNL